MAQLRLGAAIGRPTENRRQLEMWPRWMIANPEVYVATLQGFLAESRAQGLTQIETVECAGQVVVIATRPGDRTGRRVML